MHASDVCTEHILSGNKGDRHSGGSTIFYTLTANLCE